MKILSITAGAAGMYCGSCFRDNALAAELIHRGHDVVLQPVYTPTRTDEQNVSAPRVLFGGISVYLQQRSAFFRALPRILDRLWDTPAVIRTFANRAAGTTDPRMLGELTVSMLQGEHGVLRREFEKLVEWFRHEPPPDVVNLPNSLLISMAAPIKAALGRPVCCTLQGEELFLNGLHVPFRDEALRLIREQVRHVDRFIAVSDYCAEFMGGWLNIPREKMAVVPLGIRTDGYERRERAREAHSPFRVGYFARIAPEKGLLELADAYVRFRRQAPLVPARLDAAGYLAPSSRAYLHRVERLLEQAGLSSEFTYRGEVDRDGKLAFLGELDVLSVPATYDEPKGMFLLEAMARGVPVVQPRRGAFVEIVQQTGGGVLVEPDNVDSLAEGLRALADDDALLDRLSAQAFDGVRRHYTIQLSAAQQVDVYRDVIDRARAQVA